VSVDIIQVVNHIVFWSVIYFCVFCIIWICATAVDC